MVAEQAACPSPITRAVVLAVLAFFALRPGKGWLRRTPPPPSQANMHTPACDIEASEKAHAMDMVTPPSSKAGSSAALEAQPSNGTAAGSAPCAPPAAPAVGPLQAAWTSRTLPGAAGGPQ